MMGSQRTPSADAQEAAEVVSAFLGAAWTMARDCQPSMQRHLVPSLVQACATVYAAQLETRTKTRCIKPQRGTTAD